LQFYTEKSGFHLDVDYHPDDSSRVVLPTHPGVTIEEIRHESSIDDWQGDATGGLDPLRRDYASFATLADPDGNT
jgi:hypothetical protein